MLDELVRKRYAVLCKEAQPPREWFIYFVYF